MEFLIKFVFLWIFAFMVYILNREMYPGTADYFEMEAVYLIRDGKVDVSADIDADAINDTNLQCLIRTGCAFLNPFFTASFCIIIDLTGRGLLT
jgi:hypothetical protein